MLQKATLSFEGICESGDQFLALFPHRYDYIWAEHTFPNQSPDWKTESRHALSDRLIQQGAYLYGVRFGKTTNYCLLDIDTESRYHPQQDPFAIDRIVAALEPLGLVSYVACTSSYSGGLHLYFPFSNAQETGNLAIVLSTLLENAGFKLSPGQLEVFPNPRPYIVESAPTLFNAHRLPMQIGSYLLNGEFEPICSHQHTFVQHWQFAQHRNCVDSKTLRSLLKQFRRQHFRVTGKAEKFINDLSTEIEFGWTGAGQTNRLLGRIAMRAYVFHHVLHGGEPLKGQRLVDTIVSTARSLPGYQQWCRHQHEIEQRAAEWARCVEASRYFHYGEASGKYRLSQEKQEPPSQRVDWNQKQSQATRNRIRAAIADLLEKQKLPSGATARFRQLLSYGVGGASLYRHRDLWHPACLAETLVEEIEPSPEFRELSAGHQQELHRELASDSQVDMNCSRATATVSMISVDSITSAIFSTDSMFSTDEENDLGLKLELERQFELKQLDCAGGASNCQSYPSLFQDTGSNSACDRAFGDRKSNQIASSGSNFQRHSCSPTYLARLQRYLESGDPILVAEAQTWAEANPGVLDLRRMNWSSPTSCLEMEQRQSRNVSQLLATIAVQTIRLQLSPEQVSQHLQQLFGKPSLVRLEDMELAIWQTWLEAKLQAID